MNNVTRVDNLIAKLFTKIKKINLTPEEKKRGLAELQQMINPHLGKSIDTLKNKEISPLKVDDLGISSR